MDTPPRLTLEQVEGDPALRSRDTSGVGAIAIGTVAWIIALILVIALGASQIVYVSCDVATFARDARGLVDAGYALTRIDAFDLFPNTPHVETVAAFTRR